MPDRPLRIVFAGTPEFAARHLQALLASRHELIAVYTQPDRPAGRGKQLTASPVKALALSAGITVHQPASLKSPEAQQTLAALAADIMVVVAYGLLLPQAVLDMPRLGCVNVHGSLLPRWRGAAPIQRAIEAGDAETGITIMQMDAGLDTGDMLATARCPIGRHSAASLLDALADIGPPLLLQVLDAPAQHQRTAQRQREDQASYAAKLRKDEAPIDWSLDAATLDRRIRAFNPFPVCYGVLDAERIRVLAARPLASTDHGGTPGAILTADDAGIVVRCGDGALAIDTLQLPGGKPLSAAQVLAARRARFAPGTVFDLAAAAPA